MRKYLIPIFTLMLIFLISGCGCNSSDSPEPIEPTTAPYAEEPTLEPTEPVSEEETKPDKSRPYCVMIDNDSNASRPHAGLEDAYIVYEMYVEGRATRLMAVFKGTSTPKIGPVRSSRHYFLDYALDNDALYSHAGYSPLAMEQLGTLGVDNLNGLVYEPTYYWRERKYSGDYHSLFTSISNLSNLADALGYRKTTEQSPFVFSSNPPVYDGESATDITIPYADFYYVTYKYDEKNNVYDRYINSSPHPTQSGARISAGQIIFQFASNYSLGDGSARQQLDTVGKGKGIFISDGISIPITWSRDSRTSLLRFYTEDGKELVLDSDEKTYVQVMPASLKYTIK